MTLRISLDIVPHGDEARKYSIGVLDIHNVTSADTVHPYHEYEGKMTFGGKEYEFKDVNHIREYGAILLLQKVLRQLTILHPELER